MLPLVSVIVPTTPSREKFYDSILAMYKAQDYPNKQILFDNGPGTIGEKRNRLCELANGSIICHCDSDDHYSPQWISNSVKHLLETQADITGLRNLYFYKFETDELFIYKSDTTRYPGYMAGATLCYLKSFWEKSPFPNIHVGEDAQFTAGRWSTELKEVIIPKIAPHDFIDGFVASIHGGNTSKRVITEGGLWHKQSQIEAERIAREFQFGKYKHLYI